MGYTDSAFISLQKARDWALTTEKEHMVAVLDLSLAEKYSDRGKFYLSRKYLDEALRILELTNDDFQLARAYNLMGSLMVFQGGYEESQQYLMKAISLFEKQGNEKAVGAVNINLGNNYIDLGDRKQALICYRKAQATALSLKDTTNYITSLSCLAQFYQKTNSDSSLFYINRVLDVNPANSWSFEVLPSRFLLANFYYEQKLYDRALLVYNQILDTCRKNSIQQGIYRAYSGIGNVYEALNEDKRALETFTKAWQLASAAGETPTALRLMEGVLYMQRKTGDYKSALETLEKIKFINDSILTIEKQLSIHDLELMYNNEKSERRNSELKDGMVNMKRQIRSNHIILTITFIFVLVLSILLYTLYKLYRQRDSAYQSLIEKYRQDIQMNVQQEILPVFAEGVIGKSEEEPNGKISNIYETIVNYFESERPFLNSKLKVEDISNALNINRRTITTAILENTGMHFISFVNNYRVREALRLLASSEYQNIKIEYIARESGFGSKVSFYAAFTQITGYKPSSYREKAES
jgi:tetratricopeptide (TPR) repeat protein